MSFLRVGKKIGFYYHILYTNHIVVYVHFLWVFIFKIYIFPQLGFSDKWLWWLFPFWELPYLPEWIQRFLRVHDILLGWWWFSHPSVETYDSLGCIQGTDLWIILCIWAVCLRDVVLSSVSIWLRVFQLILLS